MDRRRKRPTVSCSLCRRRKVRCNRELPCSNCVRSRNATCAYDSGLTPHPPPQLPLQLPQRHSGSGSCPASTDGAPSAYTASAAPASAATSARPPSTLPTSVASPPTWVPQPWHQNIEAMKSKIRELEERLARVAPSSAHSPATTVNPSVETASSTVGGTFHIFHEAPSTGKFQLITRKVMHKTRLFGQTHWINGVISTHMIDLFKVLEQHVHEGSEIVVGMDKCKSLARFIKSQRAPQWPTTPTTDLPPKHVADGLVECYLRTSEAVYRVLHVPTFRREYDAAWASDKRGPEEQPNMAFIVQLKLVLAIGAVVYDEQFSLRSSAIRWVYEAQNWLSEPEFKSRLSLKSLQIEILLLLARETSGIGGALIWVSAGALLRSAVFMGMHRDPANLFNMSVLNAEMRRRLWNTILELNLHASMTAGGSPFMSLDDFDTQPPGNFDDDQLLAESPVPKPEDNYTQTSIAISLRKSFGLRLTIVKFLNGIGALTSYEDMLRLDTELRASHRMIRRNIQSYRSRAGVSAPPPEFATGMLDFVMYRYLSSLHTPFFGPSMRETAYAFSRQVVVDTSLKLWATIFPSSSVAAARSRGGAAASTGDLARFTIYGSGCSRTATLEASILIMMELKVQLEEDESMGPVPLRPDLLSVLDEARDVCLQSIKSGETNIKGYWLMCVLCTHVEALMRGVGKEELPPILIKAACEAEEVCRPILEEMATQAQAEARAAAADGLDHQELTLDGINSTPPELTGSWGLMMSDVLPEFVYMDDPMAWGSNDVTTCEPLWSLRSASLSQSACFSTIHACHVRRKVQMHALGTLPRTARLLRATRVPAPFSAAGTSRRIPPRRPIWYATTSRSKEKHVTAAQAASATALVVGVLLIYSACTADRSQRFQSSLGDEEGGRSAQTLGTRQGGDETDRASQDSAWSNFAKGFEKLSFTTDVEWSKLSDKLVDLILPEWSKLVPGYVRKLQRELSMAPGSLADEIWNEAHDPFVNPEIQYSASVRVSDDLCDGEKEFLARRKRVASVALSRYLDLDESDVHPDDVPVIAMCGSGGGLRALVAGAGSFLATTEDGLFDCVTYLSGVSGSCWLLALYYSSVAGQDFGRAIDHLKARLGVHIAYPPVAFSSLVTAPTNKHLLNGVVEKLKGDPDAVFGLVDVYGLLLAARLLIPRGELGVNEKDFKLSNQRDHIRYGQNPLPIYTAVRHEIPELDVADRPETASAPEDAKQRAKQDAWFQWFEITPYEFFCEEFSAGIPTWAMGRRFKDGVDVPTEDGLRLPEVRLPFLFGTVGSAFCATLSHYYREIRPLVLSISGFSAIDEMIYGRDEDLSRVHPIEPATILNFAYAMEGKLPKTVPRSIYESEHIQLMDAGMSNNIPVYPLLRPGRDVDVIISFDASADIKTDNWLSVADGYARQREVNGWPVGIGWPRTSAPAGKAAEELTAAEAESTAQSEERLADAKAGQAARRIEAGAGETAERGGEPGGGRDEAEAAGELGYCTVWVGTKQERTSEPPPPSKALDDATSWKLMEPEAGLAVVYCPLLTNPRVPGVDPAADAYMSTWNFIYTPEQVAKVVALAGANYAEARGQIRATVRAVYERKRRARLREERRVRDERYRRLVRGEGDHFS